MNEFCCGQSGTVCLLQVYLEAGLSSTLSRGGMQETLPQDLPTKTGLALFCSMCGVCVCTRCLLVVHGRCDIDEAQTDLRAFSTAVEHDAQCMPATPSCNCTDLAEFELFARHSAR